MMLTKQIVAFKNFVVKNKAYLLSIFIFGLICDIFFYSRISDLLVIFLIIFWIGNIVYFKIKPRSTLILAAIAYLIAFVFQFFGLEMIMEKGASWFIVFLSIALIQRLVEIFRNEKKV